jgi:glycosyltransferase involved in cell wall biosynthesis
LKKVLLVIDSLGTGGAQNQLVNLAIGLKQLNYDVSFFVYFPQDAFRSRLEEEGIVIINESKKDKIGLSVVKALKNLMYNKKFDFVISYLPTPGVYAALALKLVGLTKTKLITSERTSTNLRKFSLRLQLQKFAHYTATAVVFNSIHERKNWMAHFPFLKEKSYTIYNGIDNEKFSLRFAPKSFNYRLLVVGSVSSDKNGLCIIEALNLYNKTSSKKISITWVGQKVYHLKGRREYLEKMERSIKAFELQNYWKWEDPQKNLLPYYHNYDALVHASSIEGLPNVVCEALSCGLPVIASAVHDHPLLVEDNKRGFLFNPQKPEDLVDKIKTFYRLSTEELQEMSMNERKYAEQCLSLKHFIESYDRLLHLL